MVKGWQKVPKGQKLAKGRLSKSNFFCATNISVQKFCANKIGQKPTKNLKMTQKGKTVVNCAFLCAKAQILRNV